MFCKEKILKLNLIQTLEKSVLRFLKILKLSLNYYLKNLTVMSQPEFYNKSTHPESSLHFQKLKNILSHPQIVATLTYEQKH